MADVLPVDTDRPAIARLDASTPQAVVDAWNAANPVGSWVVAFPGARGYRSLITQTRSAAFVARSGQPVVFLQAPGGYYALTHVDVVTAEKAGLLAEQHHQLDDPPVPDFHFYTRTGGTS
ncbi:hypothetical protein [Streptomyces virginiae]|uniref:hypothetical protein n=1 Tax=Streptomyces virginiae TaxID=1961 RepID=UPI003442C43A